MIRAHTRPPTIVRRVRRPDAPDYDWAAAGWAGVVAGLTMILLETLLSALFNGPDDPVRSIAAIALGDSVLPPLSPLTAIVFLAAMGVHLPLSLIYARALAVLSHGLRPAPAAAVGASFGAVLYALNYYALSTAFPWFAQARGWIALTAHLAFGVTAAVSYAVATEGRRPPRI